MSMTGLETLQQDFVEAFESFMPIQRKEGMYLHPGPKALKFAAEHDEDARGCHNTDAHLRSALVGRSETITLMDGQMDLGEFGHIYFIDFDTTRARADGASDGDRRIKRKTGAGASSNSPGALIFCRRRGLIFPQRSPAVCPPAPAPLRIRPLAPNR